MNNLLGGIFTPKGGPGGTPGSFAPEEFKAPPPKAGQPAKRPTSLKYMESYLGKNCIVTGATGAVGSKVAKKLLKAGANVYLIARDP